MSTRRLYLVDERLGAALEWAKRLAASYDDRAKKACFLARKRPLPPKLRPRVRAWSLPSGNF